MTKTRKLLLKRVYTAIFTALTFVATYIKIDFPIGGMIHLGNFVAIFVALLFGGTIGGIVGSLGMGLFDVLNGYPYTTFVRTFIVKFCFCFIIGSLLRLLLKKDKEYKKLPIMLASLFTIVGTFSLYLYIAKPTLIEEPGLFLLSSILMYVFAIFYIILIFFNNKISRLLRMVIIVSSIGILVNIILEFILRVFFLVIVGGSFDASLIASILKTPSAIVNGFITLVMIFVCFMPVYLATKNINKLNDLEG